MTGPDRRYRQKILDELARHGLRPRPDTPPGLLREAVRDLYKFEIKRLRSSFLAGRFEKRDYAGHVVDLRKRYPILSLPIERWCENTDLQPATGAREDRSK